jgi:predicted metal-dependent phosphoesterase TrpH
MAMRIDLHVHTVCSDGTATASEVMKLAVQSAVDAVSFCDADNTICLEDALKLAEDYEMKYVPGISIGAWYAPLEMNIHILGYYFNPDEPKLKKIIADMWDEAEENVYRKIYVLQKENIDIDPDRLKRFVLKKYPNYPTKQLSSIVVRQYVESYLNIGISAGEYIYKTLEKHGVGLVKYHPAEEVIDALKSAGAKLILGHPGYYLFRDNKDVYEVERMIDHLIPLGIIGLETFTPLNPPFYQIHFTNFARNKGLLVTPGSDYQGNSEKDNLIGSVTYPDWVEQELKARFFQ